MPKRRLSFTSANQFTPTTSGEVDILVPLTPFQDGATLNRTWIDVRWNQFGTGTVPPEFVNETGPLIWGLTLTNDTTGSPGIHAEDDSFDWLWREMVAYGPPVATVPDLSADTQWVRASMSPSGWRSSKGQRKRDSSTTHLHFCWNIPTVFGSPPAGHLYELFVHTLWTTNF